MKDLNLDVILSGWGTDTIHMLPAGYSKLVEKLTERLEKEREQEDHERKPQHRTCSAPEPSAAATCLPEGTVDHLHQTEV